MAVNEGSVRSHAADCGTLEINPDPSEKLYEIEEALGLITDLNNAFVPALSIGMRPATLGHPDGFQNTDEGKTRGTMRTSFIETCSPSSWVTSRPCWRNQVVTGW
jgi:hypothetical protein